MRSGGDEAKSMYTLVLHAGIPYLHIHNQTRAVSNRNMGKAGYGQLELCSTLFYLWFKMVVYYRELN